MSTRRALIESLETRQFFSAAAIAAPAAVAGVRDSGVVTARVAAAPAVAGVTAAVLGRAYAGMYTIAGVATRVSFELIKAYGNGLYAAAVTDAGVKYDGNVVLNGSALTVNWFTYDAAGAQVPVGTIAGTLNADFSALAGTVEKAGQTGTATLKKSAVPAAEIDYTYSGSYTIDGVTKKLGLKLVKRYTFGYYINLWDAGKQYDGNLYAANGKTYINWFRYDAYYNQINVGTIVATASDDGNTLMGTVTKGAKTGTAILTRPGVAPSPVGFTPRPTPALGTLQAGAESAAAAPVTAADLVLS